MTRESRFYFVYSARGELLGGAPTRKLARTFGKVQEPVPTKQRAKAIRVKEPFRHTRGAWEINGVRHLWGSYSGKRNVPGTGAVSLGKGKWLDFKDGKVFRYKTTQRKVRIERTR